MMKELRMAVENILRQKKLWKQYRQYLIMEKWSDLMGESIASVTRAERISKGILFISVKDSVWAYHLTLFKKQLCEKINSLSGDKLIKDIYFYVGNFNKQENNTATDNVILEHSKKNDSDFAARIRELRQVESVCSKKLSRGE